MGRLLLLGAGGIVAVFVAIKVLGVLLGAALALTAFLIFKVLPVVLLGWIIVRVWQAVKPRPAG